MMLILLVLALARGQNFYDAFRNYTEAFMEGYENPGYVFPYSNCLPPATQTAITDKIIGVVVFISSNNWAQVRLVYHDLLTILESAASACDLNLFYKQLVANESTSLFKWIFRLWWNSVLLIRNCSKFTETVFKNPSEGFYYLGECSRFVYPNS